MADIYIEAAPGTWGKDGRDGPDLLEKAGNGEPGRVKGFLHKRYIQATDSTERGERRDRTVPACSWNAGYSRLTAPYPYGLAAEPEETEGRAEEADAEARAVMQVNSWQYTSADMGHGKEA